MTVTHNVIVPLGARAIEFGGMANTVITHNTLLGDIAFGSDHDNYPSTNLAIRDNVVAGNISPNQEFLPGDLRTTT